jgi:succinate dehydrogenase/fumarate reductase cytochrome b subunit
MEASLRPIAIIVELAILMAVIYSLFAGLKFAAIDFGLDQKYKTFIERVLMIIGCLALVFFVAHLIAFYPRLSI